MNIQETIKEIAQVIRESDAMLINAGPDMGIDSGIPDWRDNETFWEDFKVFGDRAITLSDISSYYWFVRNQRMGWGFYGYRLNLYRRCEPHIGYSQLLEIAGDKTEGYFVLTSNIDGHFIRAGFDRQRIEEFQGSIHNFQCSEPCTGKIWDATVMNITVDVETCEATGNIPKCPHCGKVSRPNTRMIGDWAWIETLDRQQRGRLNAWLQQLWHKKSKLVVFEIGADPSLPELRYRSESLLHNFDAKLVRISTREFSVPDGHYSLPLSPGEALRQLYAQLYGDEERPHQSVIL